MNCLRRGGCSWVASWKYLNGNDILSKEARKIDPIRGLFALVYTSNEQNRANSLDILLLLLVSSMKNLK